MAIASMGVVVLDCPDPKGLADFYARVLGWQVEPEQLGGDWVEVTAPEGRRLAFQRSTGYVAPDWPEQRNGQQFHLDFDVPADRMDQAEREVLALGAQPVQGDDGGRRDFRVYRDPAGHPFCLCAC